MNTIEVDDEVYRALEKHVSGFKDTPNQVLRRMLGLSKTSGMGSSQTDVGRDKSHTKAPKVDLEALIEAGSVRNGERLLFRDYQQNKVNGVEAVIRGKQLEYEGKTYSMSALARKVMRNQGYSNQSYRGPVFWYTTGGESIHELWQRYLKIHNGQ